MVDLNSWGLDGTLRAPTSTEIENGFDCATPPRDLFNWLANLQMVLASNRFVSVQDIQNAPPSAPVNGQSWIVGTSPTGHWVGEANNIATWLDGDWAFSAPTRWMHVGLADRTDWRWDHTIGTPAWVKWAATEDVAGPVNLATDAQMLAGDATVAVTPALLKDGVRVLSLNGISGHQIPSGAMTPMQIGSTVENTLIDSSFGSVAEVTIGPEDAGLFIISAFAQYSGAGPNKSLRLHKNGQANSYDGIARLAIQQNGVGAANDAYNSMTCVRLVENDVVSVDFFHNVTGSQTLSLGLMRLVRLGS